MTRTRLLRRAAFGAPFILAACLASASASAQPVPATVILMDGDTPMGAPGAVTTLRNPILNGLGQVGFLGTAGTQFLWINNGIVWLDTDDTMVSLGQGDIDGMGHSDMGAWVYGPHVNGDDSIYTNNGLLFLEGDAAPGVANGTFTILYSPRMQANGDIWFTASYNNTGTTATNGRALYHVPGGVAAMATIVLQTGDMPAAGLALDTFGVDDDAWDVANDGMHTINLVDIATGSSTDDAGIVVNGMLVARELTPTGDGDNWDNFGAMAINNAGNYVFTGDTDNSDFNTDNFIAYNGAVALREGQFVNGILVDGTADGIDINNANQVAFIWDNGPTESLMLACDASNMADTIKLVLADNQQIDIDNDMMPDHTVTDFPTFTTAGPGVALTENGVMYVEVQLDGSTEAIISLEAACCGDGNQTPSEMCDDGGESAACNDDCTPAACGDFKINASAGEDCDEGGMEAMFCDDDCTFPACGDGNTNVTFGEDCDDMGESATCDDDCTPAVCGDGKLNITAGEQCEDGNMDDGDGCSSTCQFESTGQGGMGQGGMGTGGMGMGGMGTTNSSSSSSSTGAGTGGMGEGGSGTGADDPDAGGGCDCTTADNRHGSYGGWLVVAGLFGLALRRRRREED